MNQCNNIFALIEETLRNNASDLHISVGIPPTCRINGHLCPLPYARVGPRDTEIFVSQLLNENQFNHLRKTGEIDISISSYGKYRCRINIFRQKSWFSLAIRMLNPVIQDFKTLGLPMVLADLCSRNRGLILITGPTGAGKTTTLAAMVDWINSNRDCHIVTLEDPIEYVHQHKKSIVNQREIGCDSISFANALRAVLRQDPDVILIGEMRDLDSISIALTAAETGHLVLSTSIPSALPKPLTESLMYSLLSATANSNPAFNGSEGSDISAVDNYFRWIWQGFGNRGHDNYSCHKKYDTG